jgi:hypothetical protein
MNRSTQSEKARIGTIGENNVVSKLMQHDWDAFNANCTIKNYKSIDIVCLNSEKCVAGQPWMPSVALIQVKTSIQKNIPAGFTIGQCLDRQYLEQNVKGAYVFVYAQKTSEHEYSFKYYIISRGDFIELIYQAHKYYVYGYTRVAGEKPLNDKNRINGVDLNSPAGLKIAWLDGQPEEAKGNHIAFKKPFEWRFM